MVELRVFLLAVLTVTAATADGENNCFKPCTRDYKPVCGFNGYESKSFDNKCLFEIANCESQYQMNIVRMEACLKTNPLENDCNKICTLEYNPVCGSDGKSLKTYGNKCMFEIANCESKNKLSIARMGVCPEIEPVKNNCNKICTLDYNPVCGSDGGKMMTYGNLCSFDIANCEANFKLKLLRNGECSVQQEKLEDINETECLRPCPDIYLPVCGFDGESYQTFASECDFEVQNCRSKNHLRLIKMGEC